MKTIINIVIKEFLQIRRDRKLFGIVFMAPVLQLLFLGYAATMDVNTVHTAVFDQDKTVTSREFIRNFERSGYFSIDYYIDNYEKLTDLVDKGKVLVAIVIPKDFEKKINRNETTKLQTIFDGSDGNKTSIALGYVNSITSSYSKNLLLDTKNKSGIKGAISGSLNPEVRVWYNPDLKTRNFMIPSIMGLVLMVITTILMSMAVVKEREIGTLEQLIVTPIKPYQLILGKIIPFIIIGFLEVLLVSSIMIFWFDIPVRGSYFFLIFSSLLFVLSTLGLGLFISTISKTQQQAMMVAQFGIMMPMIYLSGFAFPIENMPKIIQYLTYVIPLRYYITILRGIILKGVGFGDLWQELLALFMTGVIILLASAMRFKKRLE
ncbi:MAG: ABC transporter permease [Bacteroidota bacterium]|nr:ABC transporter permease [Bacteroidota bacterium]MDP4189972.1 ABC transporter permease [Bacteroidota bacterium]MDP4193404.1 ABC transporter permease [Bacteroidota bacterium]